MTDDCYVPDCRAHNKDKGRVVTLIGGYYHRHKIRVENYSSNIRMPIPPKYLPLTKMADRMPDFINIETQVDVYSHPDFIFGIENIFPKDMYLHDKIDAVEFLKTLVLDYLR